MISGTGPVISSRNAYNFYTDLAAVEDHIQSLIFRGDGNEFLNFVDDFLINDGDPSLTFSSILLGEEDGDGKGFLLKPTFFHTVCLVREKANLYREQNLQNWNSTNNDRFEEVINRMLGDRRLDVRAKFTEYFYEDPHFSDAYFFPSGTLPEELNEGFEIADMTIAHHFALSGDTKTVHKILEIAPDIIKTTCIVTRGAGCFSTLGIFDVTILHLAASTGDATMCGYFFGREVNPIALDTNARRPIDYLEMSFRDGLVEGSKTLKKLRVLLEPVTQLNKPYLPKTSCVIHRNGYDIVCDTRTKNPIYVYQRLTKNSLQQNTTRKSFTFNVDCDVPILNRSSLSDYKGSGYDRGHLASAADAVASEEVMKDTFLLTNISPQVPGFNRGYWKKLETQIRTWVKAYDLIEVFTGCLYLSQNYTDGKTRVSYEVLGSGEIAVPTHFFKVLYCHRGRTITSHAFILPNTPINSTTSIESFLRTVDEVQRLSGILFNQSMP